MKIQIDIPENVNQNMKVYKELHGFKSLQKTAVHLIEKGLLSGSQETIESFEEMLKGFQDKSEEHN